MNHAASPPPRPPRSRRLAGDLERPRLAIARLVLAYVTVRHEQARGPVWETIDKHTVTLSWRSTGRAPARRTATSTVHLELRFRTGTLTLMDLRIRSQAGMNVGLIDGGPEYQQRMASLTQGLETQLLEAEVLTRTLDRMAVNQPAGAQGPRARL